MAGYTLKLNNHAIDLVGSRGEVRAALEDAAQRLVDDAASRAPRDTGAGADSIHFESEVADGSWVFHISWDKEHYYMRFQNEGTKFLRPHEFLRSALLAEGGTLLR